MTDTPRRSAVQAAAQAREERRAAALRENLRRRKEQARARHDGARDGVGKSEEPAEPGNGPSCGS